MTEEQQLIRRMLGGDEQAFEAFFNAYFARVYRFALPRLNGDADATREVVQSTLAKAMRRIGDFRGNRRCSRGSARSAAGRQWITSGRVVVTRETSC